jgi:hypothetical protein
MLDIVLGGLEIKAVQEFDPLGLPADTASITRRLMEGALEHES